MKHLKQIQTIINQLIDWTFPYFGVFLNKETYRYAFCGGLNTIVDLILYFVLYHFVLQKQELNLYIVAISPHIAAFLIVFPFTFSSGFLLSKYITFTESPLRGRIQLLRYGITVTASIILNYIFLKLFVDILHLYPTPSKFLTTGIVIVFSYFSQRHFTFKSIQVPD